MPHNKRESLIYTIMMCFVMVLWMSVYNISLHRGQLTIQALEEGWIGFPLAYVVALCCDWFLVSKLAKGFAFRFLIKEEHHPLRKAICISTCMVVPMVILMSFYGALEVIIRSGQWNLLFGTWISNIPVNFVMALPFQLLIAGPVIRKVFRLAFPVGTVLE